MTDYHPVQGRQWAYVHGEVAFATSFMEAAKIAAQKLGLEPNAVERIENLAAIHKLPDDLDVAYGIVRGNRPQIYLSNVDRTYIFSCILEVMNDASKSNHRGAGHS